MHRLTECFLLMVRVAMRPCDRPPLIISTVHQSVTLELYLSVVLNISVSTDLYELSLHRTVSEVERSRRPIWHHGMI